MSVRNRLRATLVRQAMHSISCDNFAIACRILTQAHKQVPDDTIPGLLTHLSMRAAARGLAKIMFKALEPLKQLPSDELIGICVATLLAEDKFEEAAKLARKSSKPIDLTHLLTERAEKAFQDRRYSTACSACHAAGLEPPIDRLMACGRLDLEDGLIRYGSEAYKLAGQPIPADFLATCRRACINKGDLDGFTATLMHERRDGKPDEWTACGLTIINVKGSLNDAFFAFKRAYAGHDDRAAYNLALLAMEAEKRLDHETAFKACRFLLECREKVPTELVLRIADMNLACGACLRAFMLYDFILALETP